MKCYTITSNDLRFDVGIRAPNRQIIIKEQYQRTYPVPIPDNSRWKGGTLFDVPNVQRLGGAILLLLNCGSYLRLRPVQTVNWWINKVHEELIGQQVELAPIQKNQQDPNFVNDPQSLGWNTIIHVPSSGDKFVGLYIVPRDSIFEIQTVSGYLIPINNVLTDCVTFRVSNGTLYKSNPRVFALEYLTRSAIARTFGEPEPERPSESERFSRLEVD